MQKKESTLFFLCMLSMLCSSRKKYGARRDPTQRPLDVDSPVWMLPRDRAKLEFRYRFRREQFLQLVTCFNFMDANNTKNPLHDKQGHRMLCRLNTAVLHLAYPKGFGDLVNVRVMPSNGLNGVFKTRIDHLCIKYDDSRPTACPAQALASYLP